MQSRAQILEVNRRVLCEPDTGRPRCDAHRGTKQCVRNRRFWIDVRQSERIFLFRIDVREHRFPFPVRGDRGAVRRELYTYQATVMLDQVQALILSLYPLRYCEGLITPWNCLDPDGPICLDSTKFHGAALVPNQPARRRSA